MRYNMIQSIVIEISPFMPRGHDSVAIFSQALPLRNGHGIIDNHPRALYDASF